jgi:TPR repeat protein
MQFRASVVSLVCAGLFGCGGESGAPPVTPAASSGDASGTDGLSASCDSGDPSACFSLGQLYRDGRPDVPKNATLAAQAYEKACAKDHARACSSLGGLYAAGEGVAQDYAKGSSLRDRACTLKDADACHSAAFSHAHRYNSLMSVPDESLTEEEMSAVMAESGTQARHFLKAACDLGQPCSCLAVKDGDCNRADVCAATSEDGSCIITCAEELGCSDGVFVAVPIE